MTDPTDTKDESMVDVSRAADEQPPRRKSTLILTDEMDVDKVSSLNAQSDDSMHVDK
jgi:5'-AMP-activated protein kinase regulatory beta subunit